MPMIKFDNEINWKDVLWFILILSSVIFNVAMMPAKVLEQVEDKFARKETVVIITNRLDRIENKLDRLLEIRR